jgi:hypothetical protein
MKIAETCKVGKGREDPNKDPYLPPPIGRMQFSWNPYTLIVKYFLNNIRFFILFHLFLILFLSFFILICLYLIFNIIFLVSIYST